MPDFISTQSKTKLPDAKADAMNEGLAEDQKRPPEQDDEDFLTVARKRFDRASAYESANRKDAIDDLMFKNGEQWPANIRTDRTLQKRPCLTINKMKTFVHQVTNNLRQNRPAIKISPVGDGSDKNTAQMLEGLIRQVERQSKATIAYDTGFDSAVSNGWGYWRLITEWDDENSFDQVLRVIPIRNPFRVYLDPDSQMPSGSDAKWGFISDLIPREEFNELYPDADPVPWEQGGMGDDNFKDWSTNTHVRIAEYFNFDTETRRLIELASGETLFEDDLPEEARKLVEVSPELVVNEREVEVTKVIWSKITAHQILEQTEWIGKHIPIIRVCGDVIDIEGRVNYSGLIRDAKDPQRMKNYWATAKTELIALAPKAPWVMEEGQIEGHEQRWQQANLKSYPYLLYKGTSIAGKQSPAPQRQAFAGPPAGVIEAEQSAEQDMMGTTGVRFDSTKQERIPDESGKALQQLRFLGELGSFHYTVNFIHALEYTAEQFIDIIPKITPKKKVVTILREDDTEENVTIDPQLGVPFQSRPNPQKMGKVEKLYNPGLGKYAVAITTGPNFQTKRQESVEGMNNFMRAVGPDAARLIAGPMARNMDWPGAEQIAERMDSVLPPQVLQKGLEQQFGDLPPQVKSLIGAMQNQMQQMQQQLAMAGKEVEDKRAELSVKSKIGDQNYDAKILDIAAKLRMHMEDMINERLGVQGEMERDGFESGRDQHNKERDREIAQRNADADRELAASAPAASGA